LEQAGNVGFKLYDTRGKLVASIAERAQGTGDQFIGIGTSGLSEGTYMLVGQRDGAAWGSWPVSITR
jgi:hypothetical protein